MTPTVPPAPHSEIPGIGTSQPGEIAVNFGRSVVRLRLRDWLVVGVIVAGCFLGLPIVCEQLEPAPRDIDGRVPYAESEDYWNYRRRVEASIAADRIPIIGDSVVWGDFVTAEESLSACLNSASQSPRFANAGLNGTHPLALKGLVDYYAGDVHDRAVILHCNLLWMSSPDRDLQSNRDVPINHTRLIPQFWPRIPSYKASFAQRLGIVIDRATPFFDCVSHLRTRYFSGQDLQTWSVTHPYDNPLAQFHSPPAETEEQRHKPVPWTEQGIQPQDMPWIDLATSLQWSAWRETLETLRSRRNRVLVLIGPVNEHLLQDASRERYQALRHTVEQWLKEHDVPSIAPQALPSDEYGDASHPLAAGYARLAQTLIDDPVFQAWLHTDPPSR